MINVTNIKATVSIIKFEEGDIFYLYVPSLDITSYGNNENEADYSLKVSIAEFFKYTLNKKTLESVLRKLGWIIKKEHKYKAHTFDSLIKSNSYLSDIVIDRQFQKIDKIAIDDNTLIAIFVGFNKDGKSITKEYDLYV